MATIGNLVANLGLNSASFTRGLQQSARDLNSFQARLNKSLGSIQRNGGRAMQQLRREVFSLQGALAGLGVGLGFRAVMTEFSGFEKGLIGVGKTADLSGRQLTALGNEIQKISRRVPLATGELLGIAQAAGQLGVKGTANIAKFTETVGRLGISSNLAGEEAATALARILTVTGTAISDVDRLASTIVDLGNNFAATESEIAGVATRIAQSTAQFSVTAAETAGIATALRAVGVEAESGGTVVGRAFQSINDALRQGGDEMAALQRITGQTREAMADAFFGGQATQVFEQFIEGLGRIQRSGGDVNAVLQGLGLDGVRVVQVLGTLATRSEVLGSALGTANAEWKNNGALLKESLTASKSFSSQMQFVVNSVDEAAVEIGRALAPAIVDVTGDFRDFIRQAKESGAIAKFAQDLGDAFSWVARNLDLIAIGAAGLTAAKFGLLFGPQTALAAGAVAAALAAIGIHLDEITAKLREWGRASGNIWPAVTTAVKILGTAALNAFEATAQLAGALGDVIFLDFSGAAARWEKAGKALKESVDDTLGGGFIDEFQRQVVIFQSWLRRTGEAMSGITPDAAKFQSQMQRGAEALEATGAAGKTAATGINDTGKALDGILTRAKALGDTQGKLEKELADTAKRLTVLRTQGLAAYEALAAAQDQAADAHSLATRMADEYNRAVKDGSKTARDFIGTAKEVIKARDDEAKAVQAARDAQDELQRAAEKAAEDQAKLQKELGEWNAKPLENAIEDVQRTLTDTFDRALDGSIDSLKDFADSFMGIVKRLGANLLSQQLVIPIIAAGAGSVGISPQALGFPAGVGGGSAGGAGSVGAGDIASLGGLFREGFFGGASNVAATLFGTAPSAVSFIGAGQGALTGTVGLLGSGGQLLGSTGLANFVSGGLSASPFGAIGSIGANLLGLGGGIGGSLGGMAGSFIGGAIGGPIGAVAGGFLGTAVGGLFGNDKKPQVTGTAIIGTRDGNAFLKDVLRDDLGKKEAQQFGQGVAQQLQALQQALGGEFLREFQVVSNFGENKRTTLAGGPFGKFPGTKISGDPGDIEAVIRTLLGRDDVFRIGGTEGGRIQSEVQSILSATDDLDAAITAGSFLRSVFQELPDPVTEAGKALQEFRKFIGQFSEDTEALVRSNLAGQFNDEIERAILAITDPEQLALEQFEQMAAIRRKTAEELGADLVQLERLTALEREQILKQFGQDSSTALQAALGSVTDLSGFLQRIQFGDLSPLSPQDQLALAQSQFQAVSGAALAGDFSSIQQLPQFAEPLLRAARDVLGSGTDFADVFRSVVDVIDQVAAQPADDLVQKAILAEAKTQNEVLLDGFDKLAERLDQLRQELRQGSNRPAQLAA